MHTLRHTNATLFVTVLSACLGLLIAGVPSQIQAQQEAAAVAAGDSQSATGLPNRSGNEALEVLDALKRGTLIRSLVSFAADVGKLVALDNYDIQAQKLAVAESTYFSRGACHTQGEPEAVFYHNPQALADHDQVLIVTRLPRAALTVPLVWKPAAN